MSARHPKTVAVIPARFQSQRFPGKVLHQILGKSLIQRTYETAKQCAEFQEIWVATDDVQVARHVGQFGGSVVLTDPNCPSGTDRVVEAIQKQPALADAEVVVNIQGDEPCFPLEAISAMVRELWENPDLNMATALTPIRNPDELHDPSVVKCVVSREGYALYFSRSLIPGCQDTKAKKPASYYKHLGLYAFRRPFLLRVAAMDQTPLQQAEDLEQLKVLEHGERIKVVVVAEDAIGVNTPDDILKVERYLWSRSTSFSQAGSSPR